MIKMVVIKNTQRTIKLNIDNITEKISKVLAHIGYPHFDISLWFCSPKKIRVLNKNFRGKNNATDILSFPFYPDLKPGEKIKIDREDLSPDEVSDAENLGDIVLCPEVIKKRAKKIWNRDFESHLDVLLVHGIAHLLGHDHIKDSDYKTMQKFEDRLLEVMR